MKFNVSKCFVISVTQSKKYKVMYDYKLHSSTLSLVDPYKYLGVVLQSHLMWSKHIEAIIARTNSTLGIMCCNIKKASKSVKEQIHKVLIRSQLEYACAFCMVTVAQAGYYRTREGATSLCPFCI